MSKKNHVLFNGRTAVHKGSEGVLTTVDVCLTKVGKSVKPIPYTNIARSADATRTATTVFINGHPVCHKQSIFATSTGDEPGNRLGVKSHTIKGIAQFVTASPNIFIEGIPVVRNGDLMVSNNCNTAPMPLVQPDAPRPAKNDAATPKYLDESEPEDIAPVSMSGFSLHIQGELIGSINPESENTSGETP